MRRELRSMIGCRVRGALPRAIERLLRIGQEFGRKGDGRGG
jgi:hypothetical protein